jgi:voltage-gated potassium channel
LGILRIFRVLKLLRFWNFTQQALLLFKAIQHSLPQLFALIIVNIVFMLVYSTLIFYFESRAELPLNKPNPYDSIPASFWWFFIIFYFRAVVTLTSTGYGDMVPVTLWGRLIASATMFTGVMFLAFPSMIISKKFDEETAKLEDKNLSENFANLEFQLKHKDFNDNKSTNDYLV